MMPVFILTRDRLHALVDVLAKINKTNNLFPIIIDNGTTYKDTQLFIRACAEEGVPVFKNAGRWDSYHSIIINWMDSRGDKNYCVFDTSRFPIDESKQLSDEEWFLEHKGDPTW